MFENLVNVFKHDTVQSLQEPLQPKKMGGGRTGGSAQRVRGGRVPLAVGDSRFLLTDGLFQGARQWME